MSVFCVCLLFYFFSIWESYVNSICWVLYVYYSKTNSWKNRFFFFFNYLNFVSHLLLFIFNVLLPRGWEKKTEKPIKLRKPGKNSRKNRTVKKNQLKFLKNRPVRFYKHEIEKTELNPNRKKLSQTGKKLSQNRVKPVFILKNQTKPKPVGLNRFRFFLKKISVWFFFFYKNRTEPNRKW